MKAAIPAHEGILVVDKPVGPTSFDVVYKVRKSVGHKSVGHCGTLDPLASGVVVVCVGRYTKLVRFLTSDDKRYVAQITCGASTPSLDKETEPDVFGDVSVVTAERLTAALSSFRGIVSQVPPAHSALQVDGRRLYDAARKGHEVAVAARNVEVFELTLLSWEPPTATVACHVGKGFFVRALARDLGAAVGCPAHLSALRRTHSGGYSLDDAVSLDVVRDPERCRSALRRGRAALRGVAQVDITPEQAIKLRHGLQPTTQLVPAQEVLACCGDEIVAVVNIVAGEDGSTRLVSVRGFHSEATNEAMAASN
jgi:tRNA pseudouridine55 synthase